MEKAGYPCWCWGIGMQLQLKLLQWARLALIWIAACMSWSELTVEGAPVCLSWPVRSISPVLNLCSCQYISPFCSIQNYSLSSQIPLLTLPRKLADSIIFQWSILSIRFLAEHQPPQALKKDGQSLSNSPSQTSSTSQSRNLLSSHCKKMNFWPF